MWRVFAIPILITLILIEVRADSPSSEPVIQETIAQLRERDGRPPAAAAVVAALTTRANSLYVQGLLDEAEELILATLAYAETELGPTHLASITALEVSAGFYAQKNRIDKAEEAFREVIARREEKLGESHPAIAGREIFARNDGELTCFRIGD